MREISNHWRDFCEVEIRARFICLLGRLMNGYETLHLSER